MVFSKNILHYLSKQIVLRAEVQPTIPNHRAWIELFYFDKPSFDEKKFRFRWVEIPESVYDYIYNQNMSGFEYPRFYEAKNFLEKHVADEVELEKIVLQYLDDLSLLKPSWHHLDYPFR